MKKVIELCGVKGLLVRDLGPLPPSEEGCILEVALTLTAVQPETRTALAITAWFASVAICTGLALVWIYGA